MKSRITKAIGIALWCGLWLYASIAFFTSI